MGKGGDNKKTLTNKDVKNLKKAAEDQTFGMKNKNKSKVVQTYHLLTQNGQRHGQY
jgi:hypothetical protein